MHLLRTPRFKVLHFILIVSLMLFLPAQTFAWGDKAHRIIGALAWLKLSESSKRQVEELLPEASSSPDGPLAAVSTWADRQKVVYPEQARWHFVDIPLSADAYKRERDCADGNCVVVQLDEKKLAFESGTRKARAEALMYIVHLVGDLHQPLHCADNEDRGGNMIQVKFLGEISTLHKVWDFNMIEASRLSVGEYAKKLTEISVSRGFWIEDWVNESHRVAQKYAYVIPNDRELGSTYYRRNLPILDTQLALAAEKLVQIIEDGLKPRPASKRKARR